MSTPIANPPFFGFVSQLEQQQHAREDIVVEQVASTGPEAETGEQPKVEVTVEDPKPAADPKPAPAEDPKPAAKPKPSDVPAQSVEAAVAQAGDDPAKLRALLTKANKEAAAARDGKNKAAAEAAEKARKDLYEAMGKSLGFVADEDEPTVENLQKKLDDDRAERDALREENATRKRENALLRVGGKYDANLEELLDSRSFEKKLKDIDLTADDYGSQVDDLVRETVESNPAKFRLVQVTQRSGSVTPSGDAAATAAKEDDEGEDPITRERKARAKLRDR